MTLAEAIKHVLLHRSKSLLSDFFLEDFKTILADWAKEISLLLKTGAEITQKGSRFTYNDVKEALQDSYEIVRVLPGRIKDGFQQFYYEFLNELESIPDAKEKSIFSIKVIGSLVTATLGILYNVRRGTAEVSLRGLKKPGSFTRYIAADLLIRISHALVLRFLNEIDSHIDDDEEKTNLRYFINLMSNQDAEPTGDEDDKAIQIVQHLRSFIMTGQKEI